jgi:type IV pilus assembly protein PilO
MNKFNLNTIYDWPLVTRILMIGLICSVVFYSGNKIDISMLQKTLQTNQQEEKNLKQQIEGVVAQQKNINAEISLFPAYNAKLKEWKSKFVNYSSLPDLLNQILKIGSDNELHFRLFSPDPAITEMDYLKVPIKIVALGNYHQISNFISQIANMQWIVTIKDFVISSEQGTAPGTKNVENVLENSLSMELLLDVYYLAETKK